jgi:hypothetical protein
MPWYIPLLIFIARIGDVSIGTVRTILVLSGYRVTSALLGAVEVMIWVLAVGGVIRYLNNPLALLGYAGGFAAGVLVGMTIEEKLALGYRLVRIITPRRWEGAGDRFPGEEGPAPVGLAAALRRSGFRATRIEGEGPEIGDRIEFEDFDGRVTDITLSYTYVDPGDGSAIVIPNQMLVEGIVHNRSTGDTQA